MRKLLLLSIVLIIFPVLTFSQTLMDYVLEQRGDTLVVKDEIDHAFSPATYSKTPFPDQLRIVPVS